MAIYFQTRISIFFLKKRNIKMYNFFFHWHFTFTAFSCSVEFVDRFFLTFVVDKINTNISKIDNKIINIYSLSTTMGRITSLSVSVSTVPCDTICMCDAPVKYEHHLSFSHTNHSLSLCLYHCLFFPLSVCVTFIHKASECVMERQRNSTSRTEQKKRSQIHKKKRRISVYYCVHYSYGLRTHLNANIHIVLCISVSHTHTLTRMQNQRRWNQKKTTTKN